MSIVAGVAALGIALFPTGLPRAEEDRLTPLQRTLGELAGEVAAVLAFGTSWLAKGSELRSPWPRRSVTESQPLSPNP